MALDKDLVMGTLVAQVEELILFYKRINALTDQIRPVECFSY